mmetsp:Transcript_20833/g.19879  ORF Transcript_20833/g.19879 Transcript_20833/m.19879 type:complete len:204 (-) Transcript_20833:986-1597(-)
MYRKILLIFVAVFVQAYGVISQALIVFIMLIGFLLVTSKKKPFVSLALNDLEIYSLSSSMITVYCALFFISDTAADAAGTTAESTLVLSEEMKLAFFVLILFSNLVFILYWTLKMYQALQSMLILKMGKIYIILCLCCRAKKLEVLQKKMLLEQENEFMREDFFKVLKKVKKMYNEGEIVLNKNAVEKLQVYFDPSKIRGLLK